jgi:phosphohistidine phosphatase
MQLLIVRHADAGDAGEFAKTGQPDHLRPLSAKGRKQIAEAAEGLLALVPSATMIVTSPYTRAVQTAEIIRTSYDGIAEELTSALEPESPPAAFEEWLRGRGGTDVVIAVGHEPNLSALITWFMCGSADARVEMKKSGAALIVFDAGAKSGDGVLRWLMGPKELRARG